jgi:hypothetical protein
MTLWRRRWLDPGEVYPEAAPQGNAPTGAGTQRSSIMIKRTLTTGLALGVVLGFWSPAPAEEYNDNRPYLPPSGQVKINNARAQIFALQSELERKANDAEKDGNRNSCPDGVFVDRSNPRREVIIATKDIVNLGGQLDLSASCR